VVETRDDWANTLAATCRSLTEDLAFPAEVCASALESLREAPIVAAFLERRSVDPTGSEPPIQQLRPLLAFSLHRGRYRAATWHQEQAAVVWLLASHIHREGSPDDAYHYFERLYHAGQILPTRTDAERIIASREPRFDDIAAQEIPQFLESVYANPGQVHEAVLGGRIPVRALYENGEAGLLAVALSTRIRPGALPLPPEWLGILVGAFFPMTPRHELDGVADLAGTALRPDEIGFCALVDAPQ